MSAPKRTILDLDAAHMDDASPPEAPADARLMEISTEVCQQVGGIYQVIRSKAVEMVRRWGKAYTLVGPWRNEASGVELDPGRPIGLFAELSQRLAAEGVILHPGHWLIAGRPRVLLLEFDRSLERVNELKHVLWERHGIESPGGRPHYDEAVLFGDAVVRLLTHYTELLGTDHRVLAQFHEWLAGFAIPEIRRRGIPVGVSFTTHATQLGRYLASAKGGAPDLAVEDKAEAARFGIAGEHALERACAHGSNAFTTVSEPTARECEALLGKRPTGVTPNGLNIALYNVGHEFQTMHARFKQAIHRFCMGHFFPSYDFDLEETLYIFTSGRYEPQNKGFDLCLEAAARLNARLKESGSDRTVVFFIVTNRPAQAIDPKVLGTRGVLERLEGVVDQMLAEVHERAFAEAAAGRTPQLHNLVESYWWLRLKRTQQALRSPEPPPVLTHLLEDEHGDEVLRRTRQLGLLNGEDDRVKVVYHPQFITPMSPLWGLEYEQFVRGCHLGVFPSTYEPWGYTPLECVAMGVPTITSDLAGFGDFVAANIEGHDAAGISVLRRHRRSLAFAADALADQLEAFCELDRRDRITLRNSVENLSWRFDWGELAHAYHRVHDQVLAKLQS